MNFIPVYQPELSGNEKKYVNECLDSSWISSKGKYTSLFEQAVSDFTGIKYTTGVCNGTVALHLALVALGIGLGDEVIVPTLTYIASVNSITYTGAKPVFVDSLIDTWQINPEDIKRKISEKTKAIMVVHLYGHPCDMSAIKKIADTHNLFLIEDCAEALGSLYQNQHVGYFGDIATFSFYGNKTITTGEGGMVATKDHTIFERCLHFKGQGLARYREYWHDVIGYNYRMTNICAAIGLAQMEQIESFLTRKRSVANLYHELLQDTNIEVHQEVGNVYHSYWMVSILVPDALYRDKMRNHLRSKQIETRPTFYPVHTMPMYSHQYQRLTTAENIAWRGINLPSYPGLSEDQISYICQQIKSFDYQN